MSIVAMKRKSEASRNLSGKSNGGFSLNNPRRVESHSGETSIQTRMKGLGYVGHGGKNGKFPIRPVLSQYSNTYDPYTGARVSVKNNSGMLSDRLRCCVPVVQQASALHSSLYIKNLVTQTISRDTSENNSGKAPVCSDGISTKTYNKQLNYVKPPPMDYESYYRTRFLTNHCLPLPPGKEHYPPMVSRNRNGCATGSYVGITYEQFKAMKACPS